MKMHVSSNLEYRDINVFHHKTHNGIHREDTAFQHRHKNPYQIGKVYEERKGKHTPNEGGMDSQHQALEQLVH
jgi:hypothetical protein